MDIWKNFSKINISNINFLDDTHISPYIISILQYNIRWYNMAAITVNVEQEDKELFNSICNKLGMNISTAINIFIKKVNATRSIPFSLELEPEWNDETIAAFEEAKAISEGKIPAKRYDSWEDAVTDLDLSVAEDEPKYGV